MKKLFSRIASSFSEIKSRIGFYPTIFTFLGFILALLLKFIELTGISGEMVKVFPQLAVESGETARSILSVCIGGLISMMVFSFSMVMMMLTQASNNYSPRLLPGLISDRRHQIILGIYLATIMYNIFTLFSVKSTDQEYSLPGLSILIGIGLTIFCLVLFIYFIQNVSQSIQINNILHRIFEQAKHRLNSILKEEETQSIPENFPATEKWFSYVPVGQGYFQNILINNIMGIAENADTRLYISRPKGFFIPQNWPFIYSEKKLDDETVQEILSNIHFSRGELIETNYVLAFKQITEIAVKAMSPGINDPGTAINAVDYLMELFALRIKKKDRSIFGRQGSSCLKIESVSFKDLMYFTMASLRKYCSGDPLLVLRLIAMLKYLLSQETADVRYWEVLYHELDNLMATAQKEISSEADLDRIKFMADSVRKVGQSKF